MVIRDYKDEFIIEKLELILKMDKSELKMDKFIIKCRKGYSQNLRSLLAR
jgi:hypothetical protein